MNTKEQNCSELVASKMQEREAEMLAIQNEPESDESWDPALSVDTYQLTKVCLSYGGPADYLEILHHGIEIQSVTYRYSDWFDTATCEVEEGSALWTYASYIVEGVE